MNLKNTKDKKQNALFSKISIDDRLTPLLLLLFTAIAFLPLINQLGFYWDDWSMLWANVTQGPAGFAKTFSSDRPFLAYLYEATARLLSYDPLQWQLLTVLMRWAVSVAFWWMLIQLFPSYRETAFWSAAMLTVYPGFKQMPIAYLWSNAFIMLFAYILSYAMMLKAMRSTTPKKYILWTIPSVLCYTFCTISTEYYTGLDMVRGVIIFIVLAQSAAFTQLSPLKKLKQTLMHWLPYLIPLGIFMFWRVFIFQFPSYQPALLDHLQANPLRTIADVLVRIVEDAYKASWGAWTEFFRFPKHEDFALASGKTFWIFTLLGFFLSFGLFSIHQSRQKSNFLPHETEKARVRQSWIALSLGAIAIVFPGFPYWITELNITLSYPKDRFLVAFMFGSCIFMVALVELAIRSYSLRKVLISLFIAMAIGGNFLNANSYRKDWQTQREFINQLETRIPAVEEPVYFLTYQNPLSYETDDSLTGMINLAFSPDRNESRIYYEVGLYENQFRKSTKKIDESMLRYDGFRSATFMGTNDDIIAFYYSPPGCLRILDSQRHSTLPIFPKEVYEFMPYSNIQKIKPEGSHSTFLQDKVFKQPIEKNWCYYFQQADLQRQYENWEKIAEIGDQAIPYLTAQEASEYIPFMEAYAFMNRWNDALNLAQTIHTMDKGLDKALCPILQFMLFKNVPDTQEELDRVAAGINSVGCVAYTK